MDTSKLKPFNLERALAGDPVVTRDGFSVIEIIKLKSNITAPVLCVVEGTNWTARFDEQGICYEDGHDAVPYLFMAPKTRTVWVNLYPFGSTPDIGVNSEASWHHTKEIADHYGTDGRIGNCAHPIEIEE